jgi:hypothetical protein
LYLERSNFDNNARASSVINNNSNAKIFSIKITKRNGIWVENSSKLNIYNSTFDGCYRGIACLSNSEVNAPHCQFIKVRDYSIRCLSSAIINLEGCEISDSSKEFFYSKGGTIKITSSAMKQSNKEIPISLIEESGKITLMNLNIEWKGVFDRSTAFGSADFVQLKDVSLNGNRIADYLFQKQ